VQSDSLYSLSFVTVTRNTKFTLNSISKKKTKIRPRKTDSVTFLIAIQRFSHTRGDMSTRPNRSGRHATRLKCLKYKSVGTTDSNSEKKFESPSIICVMITLYVLIETTSGIRIYRKRVEKNTNFRYFIHNCGYSF